MREHFEPKRLLSYLFIVVIAVLFAVQWGPGSRGCESLSPTPNSNAAATVNGKEIPLADFQRQWAQELSFLRSQGGAGITEEMARAMGFDRQVLDRMVNTELLAQQAERLSLQASDAEILDILKQDVRFQKDGKFDLTTYQQVIRDYYRRTPQDFEHELRRQLAAQKVLAIVGSAAVVSDDEVKARFMKEGNRANATLVRFLPAMFTEKVGKPKADELAAFAASHQKEISDYYEANRFLYHQPERVRARHILIKVEKTAPLEKQNEARQKIENLRKEIVDQKKDFAELAKQFSEDTGSRENGGDLGFNERSAWVPEFSEAAFSLKVGEVSQPVQSQFGFHLIKVEEKQAPKNKELKEVELEIAESLWKKEKAKAIAKAEAEKALAAAKGGKKLAELYPPGEEAKSRAFRFEVETKPEAIETGEFNASQDTLPQIGAAPEVVKGIMAMEGPGVVDRLFEHGEGYVVVTVSARQRPSDEEFARQKDQLRAEAMKAKAIELQNAYLKALKSSSKVVINEEAIQGKVG